MWTRTWGAGTRTCEINLGLRFAMKDIILRKNGGKGRGEETKVVMGGRPGFESKETSGFTIPVEDKDVTGRNCKKREKKNDEGSGRTFSTSKVYQRKANPFANELKD